jgi:uncharacterized protein with HEPN domain
MSEKSYIAKSDFMLKMIANIYAVVDRHGGIVAVLDDEIEGRPAVLMAFLQIGETLNRLDALVLRECGLERDAKGSYDVRNFIAHDYLGVDLGLVEGIIRDYLPTLQGKIEALRDKYTKA